MFHTATAFNQGIGSWNTKSVSDMGVGGDSQLGPFVVRRSHLRRADMHMLQPSSGRDGLPAYDHNVR